MHIKGPVQRPTFPQPSEEPSKGVTCRPEDEDNSGPPGPRTSTPTTHKQRISRVLRFGGQDTVPKERDKEKGVFFA